MRVLIVGAGPSGFYVAKKLLEKSNTSIVTMVEGSTSLFGLLRTGVAPDHPELKAVQSSFLDLLNSERLHVYGNTNYDENWPLERCFDAVVDARGANLPNRLEIFNYDDLNVYDSKSFVAWTNGGHLSPPRYDKLLGAKSIAIFGQGNVALDVARFFLTNVRNARYCPYGQQAMEFLAKKSSMCVKIVGRKSPDKVQPSS